MPQHFKAQFSAMSLLILLTLLAPIALAIQLDQVDDFEDGGTALWSEGALSPNPPVNVASGGPGGAGDHYLSNHSSGVGGAGSKQVIFNAAQWTGDYVAAGVAAIRLDMANFGPLSASMRVVIQGSNNTIFASSTATALAPDNVWRTVVFPLTASDMSVVVGTADLGSVLASVTEVRILAAAASPARNGDVLNTTIGFDNITARATGVAVESSTWSNLKTQY